MRIAIDTNGVLRDVFGKSEQVYTKFYLDEKFEEENLKTFDEDSEEWVDSNDEDDFEYGMNLPVTSMNLIDHFKFRNEDDLYNFFYIDFPMNIFGHSASVSANTFNILNDLYVDLRDNNEITIISDEIGKSKPATLFFLSKYGCLIENIKFYSKITLEHTFNQFDVIITSNPDILELERINQVVIKYETTYNKEFSSDYTINCISELSDILKQIQND